MSDKNRTATEVQSAEQVDRSGHSGAGMPNTVMATVPGIEWATDHDIDAGSVCWMRPASLPVFAKSEKLSEPPFPVRVTVELCDWLTVEDGTVRYERDEEVEVRVDQNTYALSEARALAQAITEVCDAVEGRDRSTSQR